MRRRSVLVGFLACVLVGGALVWLTAPPRRPEPPAVFWMQVVEGYARRGVHAEPEGPLLDGLDDVAGGASDVSPTGFFAGVSRRHRFLAAVDRWLGTDLAWTLGAEKPLFFAERYAFSGPGAEPQFENGWQSYVYLPEGLPAGLPVPAALAGTWCRESGGDTWRLREDGTFLWEREDHNWRVRGRWGVRGELVLLTDERSGNVVFVLVIEQDGTLSCLPDGESLHRRDP